MIKLQQKISGGWRTLATARKHDIDVLAVLTQAFTGDAWLPPSPGMAQPLTAAA